MPKEGSLPKINIAIDGYSSCGKSTLARDLANKLHYLYIDSGAMYRAVTLYFIREEVDLENDDAVTNALSQIEIRLHKINHHTTTFLNGENVEYEIRDMQVNALVSPVAAISSVRKALVAQQKSFGKQKGVVMDGRDIGTVVFPDAELKIFLSARLPVRVERRYLELLSKGYEVSRDQVQKSLLDRDHIDSTREDSPLIIADDAIVIDNSILNREEQLNLVLQLVEKTLQKMSR